MEKNKGFAKVQSPDFNIIKMLWWRFDRAVHKQIIKLWEWSGPKWLKQFVGVTRSLLRVNAGKKGSPIIRSYSVLHIFLHTDRHFGLILLINKSPMLFFMFILIF